MALLNKETNEYLKITAIQFDFASGNLNLTYLIFKDAEQRQRYEGGLSEYEIYKNGQFNSVGYINEELNRETEKKTAYEALFDACYMAMKQDVFQNWVDC
ncbi:MAG: hypothetical protein ABFD61_00230 [Chloroherpetonaceae bacterium]|jgi:hypothetical protein